MKDAPARTTNNDILSSLPAKELARIWPRLERVKLKRGEVLYRADEKISHVYFPESSIMSVVAYTENGQSAEVAVIGNEGATGLDVIMGSNETSNEHIAQLGNYAYRMKTTHIRDEFEKCGDFQDALLHFTRKLMVQISQTALCNRLHITEKRFARWLLMCHDRSGSDVLKFTQEFISLMLGANRTTVTKAAIDLQNLGFISYSRGTLKIVDRAGLEAFTCPCYETISEAYKQ